MPSDKVQFQYEQLEKIAQSANTHADGAAAMRQRLAQHMQTLVDGGWFGEGAEVFYNEMEQQIFPAVTRLERALEALGGVVLRASDMMREAEEQAANGFKTGSGGLNGGGAAGGGNGATNGGSAGGGGSAGSPGLMTQIGDKIKFISKFFGVTDGTLGLMEKLGHAAGTWGKKLKWAGPVGDALSLIGGGLQAWDSPNAAEAFGEKLGSFGLEKAIAGSHPVAAAVLIVNDVNQIVGTGVSFAAGQLNDGVNDAQLGTSITRFDATLKNADLGNVIDGVSAVGVDFVQAGMDGVREVFNNPTPLNVLQAVTPGGLVGIGLGSNPSRLTEIGRNTLITLGHTADFAVGAVTMGPAFVDIAENSMRVGMHQAGFSQGFSETASSIFGNVASSMMSGSPLTGALYDLMGSGPKIDFSDMASSLFN